MKTLKHLSITLVAISALTSLPTKEASGTEILTICAGGTRPGVALSPTLWCTGSWIATGPIANFIWTKTTMYHFISQKSAVGIRSALFTSPSGLLPAAVLTCNNTVSSVEAIMIGSLWTWSSSSGELTGPLGADTDLKVGPVGYSGPQTCLPIL